MRKVKMRSMKGGWFIGNFEPSVYKTSACEVCYKEHHKGARWAKHFHTVTEINYLIAGSMEINGELITAGEIFVIEPYEEIKPVFLSDCSLIVVKIPGKLNDKHEVKNVRQKKRK